MKKQYVLVVIFVLCLPILINAKSGVLAVKTTIFPLYDFAKAVGKDKVDVSLMLPPGTEAHSYEPTPRDIVSINKADFFIYIGEAMEPWAHDILATINSRNLVVIEAGALVEMREVANHEHRHEGIDPHVWLDFEIDQIIVQNIADAFSKKDSKNQDFYQTNAQVYINALKKLDREYKNSIDNCKIKTVLYAGHFVFGYLAHRYGLKHISPYEGFSPDAEPKPGNIKEIIKRINKLNIRVVYYEELLEPKIAKVITKETGVEMVLLHGAHNVSKDELKREVGFIDIMYDNLEKLKKGLQCLK